MKGGFVCQKKEMTKIWKDGKHCPVTLLTLIPQQVLRYKTQEIDGYESVVIGYSKQEKNKEVVYRHACEFSFDDEFMQKFAQGTDITEDVLEGQKEVTLTGVTKGKGFQGAMKRFHLKGGPKTHGSKFHRQVGSMGNRKPRRVQKGHPHAGRMGGEVMTVAGREVMGVAVLEGETVITIYGSVPGSYNSIVKVKLV